MKRIKDLLCRGRWSVRTITTFWFIVIAAVNTHTLSRNGIDFYLHPDWEGLVIISTYGLFITFSIAARAIIRFNEWQFRMWFNFEPPKSNHTKAMEALKPLVDSCLVTLAASFDAFDTMYTRLHSESELEGLKKTPAGQGRSKKYKESATSMWFKREKAQEQFKVVQRLAETFGFTVPHMQDYLNQIRADEQAQAVLDQPATAAPATTPTQPAASAIT